MKYEQKERTLKIPAGFWAIPIGLLLLLILLGVQTWQVYKGTLMDNQTEQLLLVSQTLGRNMENSLEEYGDMLSFLCRAEAEGQGTPEFYEEFFTEQEIFRDLQWIGTDGSVERSVEKMELSYEVRLAVPNAETEFWQCRDKNGSIYLAMMRRLENDRFMSLIVDEEAYYQDLISGIHVGTNGYIVIKGSDGRIVMHPSKVQWGIDVIEGRKKLFPNLDYHSLSEMINEQISDESGIYEYESYWWTDPDLPRVRKVSAHTHVRLDEDFWIVSAVVDYSDFYTPIAAGFQRLLMVFLGVLAVFLIMSFLIGRLLLEHKRATSEIEYLRELNETLEELHRSEETIAHQQRLQVIGAMTGGIAHEFNNFLTPIMGHADLLMTETEKDSDLYDSALEIYEASEKAQELIRQISAMSRKNVETVYRSIPAKMLLERNFKMVDTICPSNVKMEQESELGEECILGNATQINQVLLNLSTNAIDAIGKRDGLIRFHSKCVGREAVVKRFATETVSRDWKRYIQISVADNGEGMEENTLRHIFEPFFTTKKTGEGTGLGLSLAEQIIRTHRGYICAESQPGQGSIFYLFLPVLETEQAAEGLDWRQGRPFKLVVADDNVKILGLLEKRMEKLDMEVQTCTRREELRTLLQAGPVDILAIDEGLEDADGIAFCMSIQDMYPNTRKLIMVNTITREIIEAKHRRIIDGWIEKPVSDTTLLAAIRSCMEQE